MLARIVTADWLVLNFHRNGLENVDHGLPFLVTKVPPEHLVEGKLVLVLVVSFLDGVLSGLVGASLNKRG